MKFSILNVKEFVEDPCSLWNTEEGEIEADTGLS
jgi:hypothetical protein